MLRVKLFLEGFERVKKDYNAFSWDDGKFNKDARKHRIDFVFASLIFANVRIERPDYGFDHFDERDEGLRVYTIGKVKDKDGSILYCTVIFIELSDTKVKIISARLSTKDERRWYNEYC